MNAVRNRVEVMHGVNLGELGRRDPDVYGGVTYAQVEQRVGVLLLQSRQPGHRSSSIPQLHDAVPALLRDRLIRLNAEYQE